MRKGFSLVELLVVIAVATLLSTVAIVYSNAGRNEISLSVEAAKISQLTLQAKQLAIATYDIGGSTPVCGYGMYFNLAKSTYSLFVYSPPSAGGGFCPSLASTTGSTFDFGSDAIPYSSSTSWNVPVAQGLSLVNSSTLPSAVAVLFFPPNPNTLISTVSNGGVLSSTTTAYVDINGQTVGDSKIIQITPAGQVSVQ